MILIFIGEEGLEEDVHFYHAQFGVVLSCR